LGGGGGVCVCITVYFSWLMFSYVYPSWCWVVVVWHLQWLPSKRMALITVLSPSILHVMYQVCEWVSGWVTCFFPWLPGFHDSARAWIVTDKHPAFRASSFTIQNRLLSPSNRMGIHIPDWDQRNWIFIQNIYKGYVPNIHIYKIYIKLLFFCLCETVNPQIYITSTKPSPSQIISQNSHLHKKYYVI